MPRILVTGAAGFLGGHIADHFAAQAWSVIGIDRMVGSKDRAWPLKNIPLDSGELVSFFTEFKPDAVIHAAGGASVGDSVLFPAKDFANGPQLTCTVLNALREASVPARLIFLSSAAVYGQPESLPVSEDAPCKPLSPYGYHKIISESLCREFFELYGLRGASARIFSAYGAGLKKQVVWDLCQKMVHGNEIMLQGTGMETRDFIHAVDVSRAVEMILERGELCGEVYNVASGTETSILDLTRKIQTEMGKEMALKFDGKVPTGNPLNWRADISRLSKLGFSPTVSLAQGIREIVKPQDGKTN